MNVLCCFINWVALAGVSIGCGLSQSSRAAVEMHEGVARQQELLLIVH